MNDDPSARAAWFEIHIAPLLSSRELPAASAELMVTDPAVLSRPDDVVHALARFLKLVHSADTDACPFDSSPTAMVDGARRRVGAREVDSETFDTPYQGQAPRRLLDTSLPFVPAEWQRVCVHGSLMLDGMSISDGEVSRWPRALSCGVGDPYCDLTFVASQLVPLIGPSSVPALFESYGIETPQPTRVEFWSLIFQLRARD